MKDPTLQEMREFLAKEWGWAGIDELKDSSEVAIYFFSVNYHGGQRSNLYHAATWSNYQPGRLTGSMPDPDSNEMMLYDSLVAEFTN